MKPSGLYCPRGCGRELRGDNETDLINDLLVHVNDRHPDRPITRPDASAHVERELISKIQMGECTGGPRGPKR